MDTKHVFGGVILSFMLLLSIAGCGSPKAMSGPDITDQPATLALVNGTLVDGTGADPVPDAVILIADDKILAVGSQETINIPEGVRTVDVGGATILPGFINAHVHYGFDKANLRAWAEGGVTTVRDESALPHQIAQLKTFRAEVEADPHYARLVSAGTMLTVPGGYGDLFVSSPEDARQKVFNELDAGADMIKVSLEDGYTGTHGLPKLTPEELEAIVSAAHERGALVSGHITQGAYLQPLLDAGVDDIAHLPYDYIPPKSLRQMVEKGIYLTPTFTVFRNYGAPVATVVENLKQFTGLGGQVALGNDYGGGPGNFELGIPMYEIQMMSRAGMTPMQIIIACTKNAAHVAHIEVEVGTLEPGKFADILIVGGNPLEDLQALTDVRMVIHNGVIIRDEIQE
jgi:imidazolonepropionase-like amidohydrolase